MTPWWWWAGVEYPEQLPADEAGLSQRFTGGAADSNEVWLPGEMTALTLNEEFCSFLAFEISSCYQTLKVTF